MQLEGWQDSKHPLVCRGQFFKKGEENSQPRKLIKEMEMPMIFCSSKFQPALDQATRSNPHS